MAWPSCCLPLFSTFDCSTSEESGSCHALRGAQSIAGPPARHKVILPMVTTLSSFTEVNPFNMPYFKLRVSLYSTSMFHAPCHIHIQIPDLKSHISTPNFVPFSSTQTRTNSFPNPKHIHNLLINQWTLILLPASNPIP